MVTTEQVRNALVEIWGCNCGLADWFWRQAAEENDSFDTVWGNAVVRLADKLGVSPEETDDVDDRLFELTAADGLAGAHADGLCEYRERNLSAEERYERELGRLIERHIDERHERSSW